MVWEYMEAGGPQLYAKRTRRRHNTFQLYRTKADGHEIARKQRRERKKNGEPEPDYPLPVPGPRRDRIEKQTRQEPWKRQKWEAHSMTANPDEQVQARRLEADWRLNPRYTRKRLGVGGQGIVELFTVDKGEPGDEFIPVKNFVMKAPLTGGELSLVQEKKALSKLVGAAHTVQTMDPRLIGKDEPSPLRYAFLDDYDSSVQEDSSGEESVDEQPPKKRSRAWLNSDEGAHELEKKYKKFREYQAGFERVASLRNKRIADILKPGRFRPPEDPDHSDAQLQIDHKDFLLLHYCNQGAVSSLIHKLAQREGDEARVPNRVLWSFWLCMIRACVGMAFPPRKFNPQRRPPRPTRVRKGGRKEMEMRALGYILTPDGNEYVVDRGTAGDYVAKTQFLEELPVPSKRWREQRIVHFDIDPENLLLDDRRHAPAGEAAAETAGAAQEPAPEPEDASLIFKPEFPNGLRPKAVRSEGRELCGIHAIVKSMSGQCTGQKRATTRELKTTIDSEAYACSFEPLDQQPMRSFFTVDGLSLLFHCWARAYSQDCRYTLVICRPDGSEVHRAAQEGGTDGAQQTNLYIGYQYGEGNDGHYFALLPVADREAARKAAEAKERERKANESSGNIPGKKDLVGAWEKEVLDEHAEIPMIKLADFGLARRVKPNKRNMYYSWMRNVGKPGYQAPESFAKDWEYIDGDMNGPELGTGTELAGNFNGSTNIFQVAVVMWQILTTLAPPEPPTAGRAGGLPAAYCPLLLDGPGQRGDDGRGGDFAWVDVHLRRTVYRCLSHDQAHRPRLATLLRDAKERAATTFTDFSEHQIRDWVRKTFPPPPE